jgi:arginyl-tRNA synthetase
MDVPSNLSHTSDSLKHELRNLLVAELARHTTEPPERILTRLQQPKNPAHGDIAWPVFEFAKSQGVPPPVAAENLKKVVNLPRGFSKVEAAGPFLNFTFRREEFVAQRLARKVSALIPAEKKTFVVEYSSPNIAKPFHVGHLRATLTGNCLDKVLRYLGENVISVNHLGDWGTQFGFVWAGCKIWGKPENPTVAELVEIYRKATSKRAKQESGEDTEGPNVNELAREYFRDLEEGKDYAVEFWRWCLDISMDYFRRTYARLGVNFDHYTGESFYSGMLEGVLNELKQAGILVESKGALGVDLGEQLGFARVATADGRSLYLTRDLATAKYRAETFRFDEAIYVVGAPQTLHFQQIVGIFKRLNAPFADKIIHVPFGTVLGMKTRGDGEFVELNDFLDEATELARSAYNQAVSKRPEGVDEDKVCEAVGLSAIAFSTLNRQRIKDVQFSWETAMAFSGDSGPYLLYAVARINSIEERARESGVTPEAGSPENYQEEEAYRLASLLDEFIPTLRKIQSDKEPAYLCSYALELAYAFSKAYQVLRVLGEDPKLAAARLKLFVETRDTLKTALELLGLKVVERM